MILIGKCIRCGEPLYDIDIRCPECGSPIGDVPTMEYQHVNMVKINGVVEGSKDDDSGSQGWHEDWS